MAALSEHLATVTDEELVGRIARGDEAAFDQLYRRYARPLAHYGARLLKNPGAGDDVAQTALFNAYRSIGRGTTPANVRAWLYQIARNAAFSTYNARRAEVVGTGDRELPAPFEESDFDRQAWLDGLRMLSKRQRDVYLLRDVNGVRTDEVAARLGLTFAQVEQALFGARNALAEHLRFGGPVGCEDVRSGVARNALRAGERRVFTAHLRACSACRKALGRVSLGGAASTVTGALRQVAQWVTAGGAAPVAAKVGALVATTALTAIAAPRATEAIGHVLASHHTAPVAPAAASASATSQPAPSGLVAMTLGLPSSTPLIPPLVAQLAGSNVLPPAASAAAPLQPVGPPPDTGAADGSSDSTDSSSDTTSGDDTGDASAADTSNDDSSGDSSTDASDGDPSDASGADASSMDTSEPDPTATDTTATDTTASDPAATAPTASDPTATDPTATDPTATDTTAVDTTATDTTATDTTTTP